MKNKSVVVLVSLLALAVLVLFNIVTVVDTYEEYVWQFWSYNSQTRESKLHKQFITADREGSEIQWRPDYLLKGKWAVHHRKVLLKQRLLTGQTWREYMYDN